MIKKTKELNWIKDKIKETEEELKKNKISIATSANYTRLLEIHTEL